MSEQFDTTDFFSPTPHEDAPAWMNDYFAIISRNLQRVLTTTQVDVTHVEPSRRYDGLIIFADGVDFNPGNGRGMYFWDSLSGTSGEWVSNDYRPAYGGVNDTETVIPMNDFGTTAQPFQALEPAVSHPIDVVQNVTNNSVTLLKGGVWDIKVSVSFAFAGVNQGRTYQIDIYNLTDDTTELLTDVFVARNVDGSNFSLSFLFDLRLDLIGKEIQIRFASTDDSFTEVEQRRFILHFVRVDKIRI